MTFFIYAALLASASEGGAEWREPVAAETTVLAQVMIIQRSSIVRIPPAQPEPPISTPIRWKEKGAPNCLKWSNMAAAMISSQTTIDLIIRGGTRYRVKLEKSCQAIDFYSGFYVQPTSDGDICEDRDAIHSRAGGACLIDKFKTLVPTK